MTDEEKKIAAIRDQFQDKLLGTWQIGEPVKQQKAKSFGAALASAFGIASDDESETTVVYGESGFQLPWTKAAFMADGGIQTSGGVYGNLEGSYTWSWEVSPESTNDSLKLVVAMDQVEYYTLAVKFGEANKAEFVFTEYGTTHPAIAATRVADCEGKPCADGDCVEPVTK